MRHLRLVPDNTAIPFMRMRKFTFPVAAFLSIMSVILFFTVGPNYGIDFLGGTVIEIQTKDAKPDLGKIRGELNGLGIGDVQVQTIGDDNSVLIRIGQQPGGEAAQQEAIAKIKATIGDEAEFRRTEIVGPRVSGELAFNGAIAMIVTFAAIAVYVWFRFEWQFAVGSIISAANVVVMTFGFYVVTQHEFNLTSLAAILTTVGYSLNDTVVVYDRIRETLRKYKKISLGDLIDRAINDMLGRTVITTMTTLIALLSLYIFGGEVIRAFTLAMIFGVIAAIFSSICVAAPVLIYFGLRQDALDEKKKDADAKPQKA
ncbi:protein translocase subunit SecF [Kaistia geumhonensis]|uniref:Protein-export membrane protein SecF n=1 Tax=Kaistia geumhonensis TaxID=410839 RepID=A0ABU0M3B9_9HYPH|nr:protein translocase subunit SecF [Kaistia geumhonensis]MCX5479324.1 protein translocase subunit SecF [Kaistia geumhonensis]MDQ0515453.1 preprotein translocase SecF subunit [Kaistia geumhonensis]